ncbi:hypothetical protein MK805_11705 [Shimazuella sp. AN120528]|uniref:hypothetical protein n=1 Tax=Shimazuella soli TaxID=1892854 RepID=UPI001F11259D|nr:hypothetical protein [Shimazuella soli]MCH5585609.1 hypothetical protein [Shimazuella soli]
MFHVLFHGDRTELKPLDKEISEIKFFPSEQVICMLHLGETKKFYRTYSSILFL